MAGAAPLAAAIAQLSPEEQKTLKKSLRMQEKSSLWNKYYSTVWFTPTLAGTFIYTIAAAERRAFGYRIGDDLNVVGFPTGAGTNATRADTNLNKAAETTAGECLKIYGISLQLTEDSDALLASLLWPVLSVQIQMNGDNNNYKLGTGAMVPGGGGLKGMGLSTIVVPNTNDMVNPFIGSRSNGDPNVANFYPFPEPMYWNPSGANDSTFIVTLKAERPVVATTLLAADRVLAPGGAAGPVTAWVHPAANTVFVGIKVHLHSKQVSPRSDNM
ncbi:MAG: hypothetical protein ACHQQR_00760 [Gemmatimonadales bacterium]